MAGVGDVFFELVEVEQDLQISAHVNQDGSITSAKAKAGSKRVGELAPGDSGRRIPHLMVDHRPDLTVFVDNKNITQTLGSSTAATFTEHYADSLNANYKKAVFEASLSSNVTGVLSDISRAASYFAKHESLSKTAKFVGGGFVASIAAAVGIRTYQTTDDIVELALMNGNVAENARNFARYVGLGNALALCFAKENPKSPLKESKLSLFNFAGLKLDRFAVSAVQRVTSKPLFTVVK